jgi:hypothetical protein
MNIVQPRRGRVTHKKCMNLISGCECPLDEGEISKGPSGRSDPDAVSGGIRIGAVNGEFSLTAMCSLIRDHPL